MKEMGFGDGELTDTQEHAEEVANDLKGSIDSHSGCGSYPGVAGDSRGCGSASLAEVLNSLPSLSAPCCLHLSGSS